MNNLDIAEVCKFVNNNIVDFHQRRLNRLKNLQLKKDLLKKKNPYLFKAKNIGTASELIEELLAAYLSSSEERYFGDFLEDLAVFIAKQTLNGHKSTAPGVDLEFVKNNIHYVVSIKSGPHWGNSSQIQKLENDLKNAAIRVQQSKNASTVRPVLGICYGKVRTNFNYRMPNCWKVVGQNFWYLISNDKNLYTDIIEPIGYRAKQHNDNFEEEKNKIVNRFTKAFIDEFCDTAGAINWSELVDYNSGNYDLNGIQI